jgi:hypothetical protein
MCVAACVGDVPPDKIVESAPENLTTPCTTGTFGNCSVGGTIVTASADYKRASAFSLADANATVTKLSVYVDGLGSTVGSQSIVGVIYAADASGAPGAFACKTAATTVAAGAAAGWVDLAISGSCMLSAPGTYYLGLLASPSEAVVRYFGVAKTGALAVNANSFASGPSSSFGSSTTSDVQMSIGATYTVANKPPTFGKTTQGAAMNSASADVKRASSFALATGGVTVTKLTAYLDGLGAASGSQSVMGVVYAADGSGGAPGTLLCQTAGLTVAAGQAAAWVDLTISGSCSLPSAGNYYLGLLTGSTSGVARYGYDAVTGGAQYSSNVFTSGPSNPWGATTSIDVQLAINASYKSTGSSGGGGGKTSTCPTGSTMLYVATTGSDSNTGTSASPLRTITKAYSKAGPGTVIIVMPGTYTDYQSGWGLHLGSSGTASAPIYLCSQTRGAAILDGQNASDRHMGIYLDGDYNVVDGFVLTGGPNGGITVWSSGNQILRTEIHHNGNVTPGSSSAGQSGISSAPTTANNVYAQNYIHDNGRFGDPNGRLDHGLYLDGDNESVVNNVVTHNSGIGLQIDGEGTVANMKVYNNVFALNLGSGMVIWQDMNGVDIKNNIIVANQKNGIYDCSATGGGVVIDHNVVSGNNVSNGGFANLALTDQCGTGLTFSYTLAGTIASDPMFANVSTSFSKQDDFQLRTGSPAIDSGLTLSSVTVDIAGAARPQGAGFDIGAYER